MQLSFGGVQFFQYFGVDTGRGRNNGLRMRQVIFAAADICYNRASLFSNQAACGNIPRLEG